MSAAYDVNGEPRYYGFYFGFVSDNKDPEKLMRVKVTVPGLIDAPSKWAWPMGIGGGPQNGVWNPPKVGTGVGVFFNQGDIDEPVYFSGWYARGHAPSPIAGASADDAADKLKVFETDRHLVVIDGRSGSEKVLVKDKQSGNAIVMKDNQIYLGGETLLPMQGALNGESIDPFTGMTHFMLGNASRSVFVKKV